MPTQRPIVEQRRRIVGAVVLTLVAIGSLLAAMAPTPAAGASGPTLKLSRTAGPKGAVYWATYSYVPDEGAGCDIRASLEWDGISAGGGFSLLGGTGCKDKASSLVVPYPPYGKVGKHRVCAVVQYVFKPDGVELLTRCVTFTVTGPKATPKPKPRATPKPTPRPTPKRTPSPSLTPSPAPSATSSPSIEAAVPSASATVIGATSANVAALASVSGVPTASQAPGDGKSTSDIGSALPLAIVGILVGAGILFGVAGRRGQPRGP